MFAKIVYIGTVRDYSNFILVELPTYFMTGNKSRSIIIRDYYRVITDTLTQYLPTRQDTIKHVRKYRNYCGL